MKRYLLLLSFVILVTSWSKPARAQFGIPNFGGVDSASESESERSRIKSEQQKYARGAPRAARPAAPRTNLMNHNSLDRYGRMDLAGRAVAGYPTVRGNINGPNAARVSRGGANGARKRAPIARRR